MLGAEPGLVHTDVSGSDEHRAIHFAVLRRDLPMIRLLMEAGSDARKGIYPHRDATTAFLLANDRGYTDVVQIIEAEERRRREEQSCPNATVSPVQDRIGQAIRNGDTNQAVTLLNEDRSLIQACDRRGGTPLHFAAEEGNTELVEWLIVHRAPLDKEDLRGLTALDRAALALDNSEFVPMAKQLLDHGAALTIGAAAALPSESELRRFLDQRPELLHDVDDNGGLLTIAVRHGHASIARLLLDRGADVDERTLVGGLEEPTPSWGFPLWHSARNNNLELTRLLLDRGADPNANVYASGWPLGHAWPHDDPAVKNLLLERGARLQPYMVAEYGDLTEARRLLANNPSEETVHELLWSAAHHGQVAIVERALLHLDWNCNDERWHWVLMQPPRGVESAAIDGHLQCLHALLAHGVKPDVARFGQTVLHFIAGYRGPVSEAARARFAALLLDRGASPSLHDDLLESTPLGWAARWGRLELVNLLLDRGAPSIEPCTPDWAQPSAWASRMGQREVLRLLEAASASHSPK